MFCHLLKIINVFIRTCWSNVRTTLEQVSGPCYRYFTMFLWLSSWKYNDMLETSLVTIRKFLADELKIRMSDWLIENTNVLVLIVSPFLNWEKLCCDNVVGRLSEGLTKHRVFPSGLQVDVEQDTGPVAGSDRSRIAAGKQVRDSTISQFHNQSSSLTRVTHKSCLTTGVCVCVHTLDCALTWSFTRVWITDELMLAKSLLNINICNT